MTRHRKTINKNQKEIKVNPSVVSVKEPQTTPRLKLEPQNIRPIIVDNKFGDFNDYVELHVYNQNNQLLTSVDDFTQYKFPDNLTEKLTSILNVDPVDVLNNLGFNSGAYDLKFNIQKHRIFNTFTQDFSIKEISPSRREIRVTAPHIENKEFEDKLSLFIDEVNNSILFKDFVLNFGSDVNALGVNIIFNKNASKYEVLIKLYEPLPASIKTLDNFRIVEEIIDPVSLNIDLGVMSVQDTGIPLQGPNFKIDVRLNNSIPSGFKNYDQILDYSLTSSYQNLLNQLENREVPEVQYDYIRPLSSSDEQSYHFENFVHFGSAVERLKNFEYKLQLIELYDKQTSDINSITGDTSSSVSVLNNKEAINTKKETLIKGFDGYERHLYFTSGTFAWPKQNTTSPYTLYHTTSSQSSTWIGDERDTFSTYGGQLLSASLFDRQNVNALTRLIPNHIVENSDNSEYLLLVNMMGQHFDQVWVHIKHLTELNNAHHTRGISKDLVHFSLKSLGLDTFDQFENSNLIEYILGEGTTGSLFYDAPANQTLVTASNAGSIPKQDITKEVWKRLYHNAPYLLKTKGTERGLKALMSCYGVPSTLLNVKEYGGSTTDKTTYKTFSYEKSGLALKGDSGTDGYFIKTDWNSDLTTQLSSSAKTVEFRIKPVRSDDNYHLWSLSGSILSNNQNDHHLILEPYTGNDISSSGDASQYGRLIHTRNNNTETTATQYFPIYNGDFWNIFVGVDNIDSTFFSVDFGAYQANFNKNVHSYTSSSIEKSSTIQSSTWGVRPEGPANYDAGASYCYIGGLPSGLAHNAVDGLRYSGSIQEVRYHFGELLSHDTLTKHALEPFMYSGNTLSSSYENVVLRLPLGSNDQQDSSSFHPNIGVNYLGDVSSNMSTQTWEEVVETHHLPTPDTVGASMTSEKVRIDTGTIDDNLLSPTIKSETSTLDRQPQDFEGLGVFFSPTNEINEDIIYTLGAFRLDDYIGDPSKTAQQAKTYTGLSDIKDIYFKKVQKRYNYWDYIKLIQYVDHTLFKLVEQFVPMKANTKTGLLIEPHFLERNKFARELPVIEDGQTMTPGSYNTFELEVDPDRNFSLDGSAVVTTHKALIDIDDYIVVTSPLALEGNVSKGRLSTRYYRSTTRGKERDF